MGRNSDYNNGMYQQLMEIMGRLETVEKETIRAEILSLELAPGRPELCFCARGDGRIRARELWRTVGDGLLFVEEEFPRCVQVHRTAPKGAERGECA